VKSHRIVTSVQWYNDRPALGDCGHSLEDRHEKKLLVPGSQN
jgi:hypothetical protein